MRSVGDRIRHMVLFEIIALGIVTAGASWITGHSWEMIGALNIMFSFLAMAWNYAFNWMFDQWDQKYRGSAKRGFLLRVAHACLFEIVLLTAGMFMVAWWLDLALLDALILDLGFSAFFLVYAFAFNWSYDIIFPVSTQAAAI